MTYRHATLFTFSVLVAACAGKTVDVGQNEEGATGNESPRPAQDCDVIAARDASYRAEALTPTITETPAHAGVWTGYIENGGFASGSDEVSLVVAADGRGTVLFGEEGALAPELSDPEAVDPMIIGSHPGYGAYEGYPYTLYRVEAIGDRLRFQIRTGEPWGPWCRAQSSYPWDACRYNCVQRSVQGEQAEDGCFVWGEANNPSTREAVSCAAFSLCFTWSACACTAESCDFDAMYTDLFDGTLTDGGARIRGSFEAQRGTVYLVRQ